jgi:hypothetical protein
MSSGPNDDADRGRPAQGAGRGPVNQDGYRTSQDGYRPNRREPDGA